MKKTPKGTKCRMGQNAEKINAESKKGQFGQNVEW
jgi:hypothetical protein